MSNQKEYLTIVISFEKGKRKPISLNSTLLGGTIKAATSFDAVHAFHRAEAYLMENEEENADIIDELYSTVVGK